MLIKCCLSKNPEQKCIPVSKEILSSTTVFNIYNNNNKCFYSILLSFTFMYLADTFIQSDLQCIQAIIIFSTCVPWELNPQTFALLTQCSTTEPQQHRFLKDHGTLKTGVMMLKIQLCNKIKLHFKIYYNRKQLF